MTFLNFLINPSFINFFQKFLYNFFHIYIIKMSKNLSAKYYQENKKNYKNHNFSKEENKKATAWS